MQNCTTEMSDILGCCIERCQGFLRALDILTGYATASSISCTSIDCGVDDALNTYFSEWGDDFEYSGHNELDNKELEPLLYRELYSKLNLPEKTVYELNWYFYEYHMLMTSGANSKPTYCPLVSSPLYRVNLLRENRSAGFFFAVEIEKFLVITGILTRTSSEKAVQ